jgi:putative transposase
MLIGFKTQLKPNNAQKTLLAKHSGVARHAWNIGLAACKYVLDHNQKNLEPPLKFPTAIDLHKWLVAAVKPDYPWYYEVSKCSPQQALRNLSRAFTDFFNKKKIRGKPMGFPRFKKKGKQDSFYLDGSISCDHYAIKLPRIGGVRTYERLPHGYKPKNVVVSRQADKWFISFKIEIEPTKPPKKRDVIGVDLGVKSLATCSDGTVFEGVKAYKKLEAKLSFMQYLLRKKVRGSQNWKKAHLKIARLHLRIANIRKDNLHKITSYLAKNHGQIVIEDLNVSGMLANHKLAKAIQDMGFSEFRRQLEYKTKLYGSEVVIVDRFYPSSKTCSNCHTVKENLSLSERIFVCDHCGLEIDRDLNASINLEMAGSSPVSACGLSKSRLSQDEAGTNQDNV